jgi:hypothetical protein
MYRVCLPFCALLWVLSLASILAGCGEWQPTAKPVQPELVLEGSVDVLTWLDTAQHFVLIKRDPTGSARYAIVEWQKKTACNLPEDIVDIDAPVFDPAAGKDGPELLLPLKIKKSALKDSELYYADEHCKLRGPFGHAVDTYGFALDGSARGCSLVDDKKGGISLVNPWTGDVTQLATGVSQFEEVKRPTQNGVPIGAQALWLIENGKLTQRSLEGKLLFTRGKDVRPQFQQALYDTLRIAYQDGSDLYEAVAPDFVPVLIAKDACRPLYSGLELNLWTPCADRQLVRIDLVTGETVTFDPGVAWSYEQANFLLEYVFDDERVLHLYATPPGLKRKEVSPALVSDVQIIDSRRIVGRTDVRDCGVSAEEEPKTCPRLGIWDWDGDGDSGSFTQIAKRAASPVPFTDTRTSQLIWLCRHDIDDLDRGTITLFRQLNFSAEDVAYGVPGGGYSSEGILQVSEPVLFFVENTEPVSKNDKRLRGRLRARLLSGELGSEIDKNVTSFTSLYMPAVPGVLYSVEGGARTGLWFAAL